MAKIKYTAVPNYPEVELVGKTTNGSVFGTVARREVGRCFITEEAGFDPATEKRMMVGGDENVLIQTVEKVDTATVLVKLAGDVKSAADFRFFGAYVAANRENEGVIDLFVKNCAEVDEVVKCAKAMCALHPESSDRWEVVCKETGKRVFIRIYADVNDSGKIAE